MDGAVDIQSFMNYLEVNDLVIVKRDIVLTDAERLERLQKKLLHKKWLTYSEIIKGQLLDYSSITGLKYHLSQHLKDGEMMKIRNVNKVLTSAIKRLRDEY